MTSTTTATTSSPSSGTCATSCKDDGVTYHQYVTELTYLLFLKMAQGDRHRGPASRRATAGTTSKAQAAPDRLEPTTSSLIHLGRPRLDAGAGDLRQRQHASSRSRPPVDAGHRDRQARLVQRHAGGPRRPLRRPAGEERQREEVRRRPVLHAAPADRLHGRA